MSRRSVRRYDREPLDEATLTRVQEAAARALPLIPANEFRFSLQESQGDNLAANLGAYGHVVSPPHYLVPYASGNRHVLPDLGYRTEQIAVYLTQMGLGSCFIGALHREQAAKERFEIPPEARIGAFLVFGRPATAFLDRTLNSAIHTLGGGSKRLPMEKIFFEHTFDRSATPPPELAPVMEAARRAPSATNAQPWRFLWRDDRIHLFVTNKLKLGGGFAAYSLHDGGICMANIALALQALGKKGRWVMYEEDDPKIPPHPDNFHPLARLEM